MRQRWLSVAMLAATMAGCGGQLDRSSTEPSAPAMVATARPRPRGVPADFQRTHNGWFHPSCLVLVKDGEAVNGNGNIVQTDGSVRLVPPCNYPRYDAAGNEHVENGGLAARQQATPQFYGHWLYLASFWFSTTKEVTWLSSDFVVPNPPLTNEADLAFWSGVQDPSGGEVIQPVLDYGDGANRWQVRGENCCFGGRDYYNGYIPVRAGDTVSGYVYPESNTVCLANQRQWNVSWNVNGGWVSSLHTCQFRSPMTSVWGGVFEINGTISDCTGLPWNGGGGNSIVFRDISVNAGGVGVSAPNWNVATTSNLSPDCGPFVYAYGSSGTMGWWDL